MSRESAKVAARHASTAKCWEKSTVRLNTLGVAASLLPGASLLHLYSRLAHDNQSHNNINLQAETMKIIKNNSKKDNNETQWKQKNEETHLSGLVVYAVVCVYHVGWRERAETREATGERDGRMDEARIGRLGLCLSSSASRTSLSTGVGREQVGCWLALARCHPRGAGC